MDKYNLHQLGWKAFETLCGHIMHQVMGITYALYSDGKDGGRDGYFEGKGNLNKLKDNLSGRFVFQCKHTSEANKSLKLSTLKNEIPKITRLVKDLKIKHYVIFTNYKVSAGNEAIIKKKFEQIEGLQTCVILGCEWFELVIDKNKILRKLVPRLYGIGDLSEILDERISKQSIEVLEDLKGVVTTFVATAAYQKAIKAINDKRFVILLGPPAVGKSAIATNICMTSIVENESTETLILENADEFKKHYNPENPKKLYWFDDVFGATNLDMSLLNGWQKTFIKIQTAINKGATVIFTSRDYIFNEAISKIQRDKFPLLFDSQVKIDVSDLSIAEKEQILYNHIKSGDLSKETKIRLKPYLKELSHHADFSPELARRLGNRMFHDSLGIDKTSLHNFFSSPSKFFENIISVLEPSKKAALILILLHGNKLLSPIKGSYLPSYFLDSFDVNVPTIKDTLQNMRNSLVKLNNITDEIYWSMYHPSMIDSLQNILAKNIEMIEIFLHGASIGVLIRDVTCISQRKYKIFVPKTFWDILTEQLKDGLIKLKHYQRESIVRFIDKETPDEYLMFLAQNYMEIIDYLIKPSIPDFSSISTYKLAIRLEGLGLLNKELKENLINEIYRIAIDNCDFSFLDNDYILSLLGSEGIRGILSELKSYGPKYIFSEFEYLFNNYSEDELDSLEEVLNPWFKSCETFINELEKREMFEPNENEVYYEILIKAGQEVNNFIVANQDREEDYRDYDYDYFPTKSDIEPTPKDIFDDVEL